MSIISIVYVPEGIAMAADSRLTGRKTRTNEDGSTHVERFTLSDNAQKIVLLNKCPVGIASFGAAIIKDKTFSDYIRLFEINDVCENDTPEAVAEKLHRHGEDFPETNFYVCGYYEDVPYVYLVNSRGVKRNNVSTEGAVQYNISWGGETEALVKLVNAKPVMDINKRMMPLCDGIDLAEFMVDLTIKYQRFSNVIKTCGGPIDVLVLTKDAAFWHKHKLYK